MSEGPFRDVVAAREARIAQLEAETQSLREQHREAESARARKKLDARLVRLERDNRTLRAEIAKRDRGWSWDGTNIVVIVLVVGLAVGAYDACTHGFAAPTSRGTAPTPHVY